MPDTPEVDQGLELIPTMAVEFPDPYFDDPYYNLENDDADLNAKQPPGPELGDEQEE